MRSLFLIFLAAFTAAAQAPEDHILLSNGEVEVIVSPALFSIVGLHRRGGKEWLADRVSHAARQGEDEWVDPGGITTDVLPFVEDAAVRRGPAMVTERSETSLTMEGPMSDALGLWLRKEIRIASGSPAVTYTVTALSIKEEPQEVSLRNLARLGPPRISLRSPKEDGSIRVLSDQQKPGPAVVNSMKYWMIPVPPTASVKRLVLGGYVPRVILRRGREEWIRRLAPMPPDKAEVPNESTFICVLDSETASYGAGFQGARGKLTKDAPVVLTEEWVLK